MWLRAHRKTLEEAQGVPRERNAEQMRKGQDYCAALAAQINEHGAAVFTTLWRAWCAGYDAAPAARTKLRFSKEWLRKKMADGLDDPPACPHGVRALGIGGGDMSDRQELIDWLRHWKHEVPTTREREEMIEAMRDAATALEEAQGVPSGAIEIADAIRKRYSDEYGEKRADWRGNTYWAKVEAAAEIVRALEHAAPAARTKLRFSKEWLRKKMADGLDDPPACPHGVMAGYCEPCVEEMNRDNDSASTDRGQQGVRSIPVERTGSETGRPDDGHAGNIHDANDTRRTECDREGDGRLSVAAPAAPTREPVSAATPRDEQDARRLRDVIREALCVANDVDTPELRDYSNATAIRGCLLTVRDILDAALAEPKR